LLKALEIEKALNKEADWHPNLLKQLSARYQELGMHLEASQILGQSRKRDLKYAIKRSHFDPQQAALLLAQLKIKVE
jgi:hypothetical protein